MYYSFQPCFKLYLTTVHLICYVQGVPPYNRTLDCVKSRLGYLPGTTPEQVLAALKGWGADDEMYRLMNVWDVHANEGWTIPTGWLM